MKSAQPNDTRGAHLLVVDDDRDLLHLLSMRLRANGYRVSTAECAEAAVALLAVEQFALVISDVRLPGRDGLARWMAIISFTLGMGCLAGHQLGII